MKIRKAALLLVAVVMVLAAASPAPASSAFCEGVCNGAEIHFSCPGTFSAADCCNRAQQDPPGCIGGFHGICEGDAEIVCG